MSLRILESPSKQKKADRCQLLMHLSYNEGWEPLVAHHSLAPRLRGTAFSFACEQIHKAIMQDRQALLNDNEGVEKIVTSSIDKFMRQFDYCVGKGIIFQPDTDAIIREELRRVIPYYIVNTPVRNMTILGVEEPWEEYGCRPDLYGLTESQYYFVGDVKLKGVLESRYSNSTISEYHDDAQFHQYNYVLRLIKNLPPDAVVYNQLLLVVISPLRIIPSAWLYSPENLKLWESRAIQLTKDIQDIKNGTRVPAPSLTHKDQWGWCPMRAACIELKLDEGLMSQHYVKLDEMPD